MKSFVCAVVIFILIFLGAGGYSFALSKSVETIDKQISLIEGHINDEKWDSCHQEMMHLMKNWKKTEKWLKSIVNHREIDRIQEILYELYGYVCVKNKEEAYVKAGVLRMSINCIPENEALSFINIL